MSALLLDSGDVDYVDDEYSAARLLLELKHQLSQPGIPPGKARETQAAINKLTKTWPEASSLAAEATDDELGRLSPQLKRTRDQHRRSAGVDAKQAAALRAKRQKPSPRSPTSSGTRPASTARPPRSTSSSRGGRRRRGGTIGLPPIAGVSSARSLTLQLVSLGLGLSLVYLLVSNAETPGPDGGAVARAVQAAATIVNTLVGTVDPLRPHGAPAKSSSAPKSTAGKIALAATVGGAQGAFKNTRPGVPGRAVAAVHPNP
jgi:hypothetical protein